VAKPQAPLFTATKPKGKENICSDAILPFYVVKKRKQQKQQQNLHIFQ
jgi:hypothetical protein